MRVRPEIFNRCSLPPSSNVPSSSNCLYSLSTIHSLSSQFKPSRLSTLQIEPSTLKSSSKSNRPIGKLISTRRSYILQNASIPTPTTSTSASTSASAPTSKPTAQEPNEQDPTLQAESANADGEREQTEVGLRAAASVGGGVGEGGGGGAGGEEMYGLRLMVPRMGGGMDGKLMIGEYQKGRLFLLRRFGSCFFPPDGELCEADLYSCSTCVDGSS